MLKVKFTIFCTSWKSPKKEIEKKEKEGQWDFSTFMMINEAYKFKYLNKDFG